MNTEHICMKFMSEKWRGDYNLRERRELIGYIFNTDMRGLSLITVEFHIDHFSWSKLCCLSNFI